MMTPTKLKIFTGNANRPLAERIADSLGDSLGKLSVTRFPDGETSVRIEEDVRGRDVFIVQPTCHPVNENLMELLVILDAFKRSSPARITVVLPYYGYARQDRKDVGRVPITAKLVANLITAAGASRVLALDLHAAQIQGFFDIPLDHLHAAPVINEYIRKLEIPNDQLVVLSPDEGSIKRALSHQKKIGGSLAIVDKRRSTATETHQANLIGGDLRDKVAILFDDMISTAGSLVGAVNVAVQAGAREIYACATHGVLCGSAIERLKNAPIKQIIITDTIPLPPEKQLPNIKVVSVDFLVANAIKRIHHNESVSKLFE
ncbi:ribose-phosphate diphosphokinase [Tuwongella immobilis]|uniref:Ribose-phosphate pyrophosphokinase n=1 Tax=Tuwongella immobilis TaxID=692036 RepID=A0A6C2YIX7_9BACT|nr:ribose-phosphate pyrophosphokinase [Tuwongella immobilis]VIP01366.1 ribose-phosphate pyrophosphokinase : Ribose-phosphate pyrophosphokinase OS=Planctomyces brasiliensis (strain ATCC 49424 / DSM 5305 / JCM 21570 / NBRC 103401 / IFAM 1448) GN=prs PE=3 SV=1: Pribosyltran_N: Pribosyl_synth [Tuwongella immobilis]VTR98191.1 ribose-phosphate pyrophosphokinase : Ribose-phosphate pyrophosphokinase OS=Planctomyces brasiliensis (strain ATCC 49424 / DSM 5305 / JCM 21570 / NBRC 103401 / IFAM 1448) GN=prs P